MNNLCIYIALIVLNIKYTRKEDEFFYAKKTVRWHMFDIGS